MARGARQEPAKAAKAAPTPTQPTSRQHAPAAFRRPPGACPGAYGAAALRGEIAALANTAPGNRNNQLNRASFSLHQLVAGGELVAGEVEQALIDAATANGLLADDGLRQCMATIKSGGSAGLLHPRSRNGGEP
jgi:hypothetical protein